MRTLVAVVMCMTLMSLTYAQERIPVNAAPMKVELVMAVDLEVMCTVANVPPKTIAKSVMLPTVALTGPIGPQQAMQINGNIMKEFVTICRTWADGLAPKTTEDKPNVIPTPNDKSA